MEFNEKFLFGFPKDYLASEISPSKVCTGFPSRVSQGIGKSFWGLPNKCSWNSSRSSTFFFKISASLRFLFLNFLKKFLLEFYLGVPKSSSSDFSFFLVVPTGVLFVILREFASGTRVLLTFIQQFLQEFLLNFLLEFMQSCSCSLWNLSMASFLDNLKRFCRIPFELIVKDFQGFSSRILPWFSSGKEEEL